LPEYLNAAIDDPSPENVRAYYFMQRLMMDKAERFSAAAQQVVTGDPLLDETNRYPTASFASNRRDDAAKKARDELTQRMAKTTGLFFFFDGLCNECGQQAYVLNHLKNLHGVITKAITMDGSPIDERFFAHALTDAGQAKQLGVQKTPAIVLVSPEKGVVEPIAQGQLLSATQIQDRMLMIAKRTGILPANDVDRANPVQGLDDLLNPSPDGVTPEILEDPVRLVEYLRKSP
jgi:conjugal transfer pilus assembly protein TraF